MEYERYRNARMVVDNTSQDTSSVGPPTQNPESEVEKLFRVRRRKQKKKLIQAILVRQKS